MGFNINNELNFIYNSFDNLHKIETPEKVSKKSEELSLDDFLGVTNATRLADLCESVKQKKLEWDENTHPLHAYASSIKEISNSLDQLKKVTEQINSPAKNFFTSLCMKFFGNSYKKQETELHQQLDQQFAKLTADLAKQAENTPLQPTSDTLTHLVTLIDLKNKISTSPLFQTAEKVNHVSRFLHQSGIFRHKILQQKEGLEASVKYLEKRVSVINRKLKTEGSLPTHFDGDVKHLKRQYGSELRLDESPPSIFSPKQIESVEKEAFHILSDHLSDAELQGIDRDSLDGNVPAKSLMSAAIAVDKHFKDPDHPIVKALQQAQILSSQLVLARAFTKVSHEDYLKHVNGHSDAMKLFEQKKAEMLSNGTYISDQNVVEELEPDEKEEFDSFLKSISPLEKKLSEEVLISALSKAIIDQNKALTKPGDFAIINAGSFGHSIIIEFKKEEDGTYSAAIFNTGLGANHHTIVESNKNGHIQAIKPFKIGGLKHEDITNYDFIAGIIEAKMKPAPTSKEEVANIRTLYHHFKHQLITEAKGQDMSDSCKSFPLQKRGTCSYSSIEAWLMSHLIEEEMKGYFYTSAEYIADRLGQAILAQVDTISAELEGWQIVAESNDEKTKTEKKTKSQAVVQRSAIQTLRLYEEALKMKAEFAEHRIVRR